MRERDVRSCNSMHGACMRKRERERERERSDPAVPCTEPVYVRERDKHTSGQSKKGSPPREPSSSLAIPSGIHLPCLTPSPPATPILIPPAHPHQPQHSIYYLHVLPNLCLLLLFLFIWVFGSWESMYLHTHAHTHTHTQMEVMAAMEVITMEVRFSSMPIESVATGCTLTPPR